MWTKFFNLKKHRIVIFFLLAAWLTCMLIQPQPVSAMAPGVSCVAGAVAHAHQATTHTCCDATTECDCQLKQGGQNETAEPVFAPSSSTSNPTSKDLFISTNAPAPSFSGRQTFDDTGATARGPTIKIYLKTLNLIC
jgi:hypothetical protein